MCELSSFFSLEASNIINPFCARWSNTEAYIFSDPRFMTLICAMRTTNLQSNPTALSLNT